MNRWTKESLRQHLATTHKLPSVLGVPAGPDGQGGNPATMAQLRILHSGQHAGKPHGPEAPSLGKLAVVEGSDKSWKFFFQP